MNSLSLGVLLQRLKNDVGVYTVHTSIKALCTVGTAVPTALAETTYIGIPPVGVGQLLSKKFPPLEILILSIFFLLFPAKGTVGGNSRE